MRSTIGLLRGLWNSQARAALQSRALVGARGPCASGGGAQGYATTSGHGRPQKPPGVTRVVAVSSGKGGVGKSTVTANLALALAQKKKRVGILDADIHGPSMGRMMNLVGERAHVDETQRLVPVSNYGVPVMSVSLLQPDEDAPAVLRGPMVMQLLQQMLMGVAWDDDGAGPLDVLLVDCPPGTGDILLTLAQTVALDGAVVVSTPQEIALIDARKGIQMFRQTHVPILGVVENMSYYHCDACGDINHVFGHDGAAKAAERLEVPFLGGIPLHADVCSTSDSGTPIVVRDPSSERAQAFVRVADVLWSSLQDEQNDEQKDEVVVEWT